MAILGYRPWSVITTSSAVEIRWGYDTGGYVPSNTRCPGCNVARNYADTASLEPDARTNPLLRGTGLAVHIVLELPYSVPGWPS